MPDHVHLVVSASPFDSPTEMVKVFKGVTALKLFKKFLEPSARYGEESNKNTRAASLRAQLIKRIPRTTPNK